MPALHDAIAAGDCAKALEIIKTSPWASLNAAHIIKIPSSKKGDERDDDNDELVAPLILAVVKACTAANAPPSHAHHHNNNDDGGRGMLAVVKALVAANATVNVEDSRGMTPLHLAVALSRPGAGLGAMSGCVLPSNNQKATVAGNDAATTTSCADGVDNKDDATDDGDVAISILKLLVDEGADAEAPNAAGLTPLCTAALHNKLAALLVLIQRGEVDVSTEGRVSCCDDEDEENNIANKGRSDTQQHQQQQQQEEELLITPLLCALQGGNEWCARILILAGAAVNYCKPTAAIVHNKNGDNTRGDGQHANEADGDGDEEAIYTATPSPLLVACQQRPKHNSNTTNNTKSDSAELIEVLLKAGADPFFSPSSQGHRKKKKKRDGDNERRGGGAVIESIVDSGLTPLMAAAQQGNAAAVDALLKGWDIVTDGGKRLLPDANNKKEEGEEENNASANEAAKKKEEEEEDTNTFTDSQQEHHEAICNVLRAQYHCRLLTAVDKQGATALILAAAEGHTAVIKRLLDAAVMAAVALLPTMEGGGTAIQGEMDFCRTNEKALKILFNYANHFDADGFTPLMVAVDGGHIDAVKALLSYSKRGASLRELLDKLSSPSSVSSSSPSPQLSKMPFRPLDVDWGRPDDGCAALLLAAGRGDGVMCGVLITEGKASRHVADTEGCTAADVARSCGHTELARILARTS